MDTWGDLFERASTVETDVATIRERLAARRDDGDERNGGENRDDADRDESDDGATEGPGTMAETDPTRVVADADVLAADLLVGGPAREALDHVRGHDWLTLVASDPLVADAEAIIADLATEDLATEDLATEDLATEDLASAWRARFENGRRRVVHPAGDHPALASAIAGGAGHVLTFDERLTGPKAGVTLQKYAISVRTPAAFAAVFDPTAVYEAFVGDSYPGPDADPRG